MGVLSASYRSIFVCLWLIYIDHNPPGTIKHIIKIDGLRGLYRGLGPTILGYLPTWAIYFAVYDGIKTHFGELPLGAPMQKGGDLHQGTQKPNAQIYPAAQAKGYQPLVREHPWGLHILSAMAAGATSTIATNPLWVIKTRFMVSSTVVIVINGSLIKGRLYRLNL